MARSFVYIVSENPEVVEKVKSSCEGQDVSFFNYSGPQWREGLDNSFFRTQLVNGVPALAAGVSTFSRDPHLQGASLSSGHNLSSGPGNVVNFPHPQTSIFTGEKVQKMEDMEAKAIEAAIFQYKGNLTEAAKALGIGRATLYRKVKQYHIDPSQARRRKLAAA